jgi:hypothetical protein
MYVPKKAVLALNEYFISVMKDLESDKPNLDAIRMKTSLAGLLMVKLGIDFQKREEAAAKTDCPVCDVYWELHGEDDNDPRYIAAVALRQQSDGLLKELGKTQDDPEFLTDVTCSLSVLIAE